MLSDFFKTSNVTIVCLVYIIIIQIMFYFKSNKHRIATKVFVSLLAITMFNMISLIVWAYIASNALEYANIAGRVVCFFMIYWDIILMTYVSIVFKTNEEIIEIKDKIGKKGAVIGIPIFIIVTLMLIFLNFKTIYLEVSKMYIMEGILYKSIYVLAALSILYAIYILYKNRKRLDKLTITLSIVTIAICTVSILGGFLGLVVNDICFLHTVVITFIYLAIEGQDKTLLDEYNESNKKAKESNELKNEFIMNMSHQLRTPMNTILGFSDILLTTENIAQSELIDNSVSIEIASKRLLELINAVLDISKLESDKEVSKNEDYNLDTVIYDVSSHINSKINKENLVFTINANENCPNDLNGDGYKLAKILNIVLSNAVKYTNYGEVSLNVSSTMIDAENHEFTFHIKNTGHAMKQEDFNRSFEDLIKLTSDNNNDIDADTLKMIVAKRLVILIGGTIDFINETGQGTQYIIKLKQKVTTQNLLGNIKEKIQTKHALTHEIINLLGKKALIVDDQKINTIILQRLLAQYNIQIDAISSPRDTANKILNENYDIIFINHKMEDMTGEEVIKKLEATGNKIPPIVGLINGADEVIEESGYQATIDCPIVFRELNQIIKKIFTM